MCTLLILEQLDGFYSCSVFSENVVCSNESQNCMLHRCSNCTGQSQLLLFKNYFRLMILMWKIV